MSCFFDTNVLVYRFDYSAPPKRVRAAELFAECVMRGTALISTQVLQEFFVTVTNRFKIGLPDAEARTLVQALASLNPITIDMPLILRAIDRKRTAQISFWDALIVEAAIRGGAAVIYSENLQHGAVYDGVRIENPFLAPSVVMEPKRTYRRASRRG